MYCLGTEEFNNADIIAINEAQFFNDLYEFVILVTKSYNKHVIIAGLDGDYQQKPFGNGDLLNLIPHSTDLVKLSSYCKMSGDGTLAQFTVRLCKGDHKQIDVGGEGKYIPVCENYL